jgi:CubicO group peptidase (beta-lactamase class C family)
VKVPAELQDLADRAVRKGQVGVVVGTFDRGERRLAAAGRVRNEDGAPPPDGETLFEIGSITKVFTALALADLALEGLVGLDDPLAGYLPSGVAPPRAEPPITLAELASHSAVPTA